MEIRFVILLALSLYVMGAQSLNCPSPCNCKGNFEVYCNGTGIDYIPTDIPPETTILDLGDNKLRGLSKKALAGLQNLTFLGLEGLGFRENDIEAGALELPNLVELDLTRNRFMKVPSHLPPKLNRLYFMYNPIEVIDATSFSNCTSLQYFDVSNCKIRKIMPHAFDPLINIDTMYLSFIPLTNEGIPDGIFLKNRHLDLLDFRFAKLTSYIPDLPSYLPNLDYVGNAIKVLPSYGFANMTNLQSLAFWEGQVTTIEDYAFAGLHNLKGLDMSNCHISSPITKNTFAGLTNVGQLELSINHIPSIAVGAFNDIRSMSSLWLMGNNLTTLEEGVLDTKYLPNLNTLFIDFNPWYCDCHLRWLREKVGNASYVIQEPHLIKCQGPPKVAGKAWDILKPEDFVCET